MTEAKKVDRVFLVKTPIKEFRCNEVRAKEYAKNEEENEDVNLEVFEITKSKKGEEKFKQVNASEI